MNFDLSHPDIKFAVDAVADAARLARKIQADAQVRQLDKKDLSPVTVADFAGQATVAHDRRKTGPGNAGPTCVRYVAHAVARARR